MLGLGLPAEPAVTPITANDGGLPDKLLMLTVKVRSSANAANATKQIKPKMVRCALKRLVA